MTPTRAVSPHWGSGDAPDGSLHPLAATAAKRGSRGSRIKANPQKITAISNMGPLRNVKGVQRLIGCLAALSRFISLLGEWGIPLYKLLKKMDAFV